MRTNTNFPSLISLQPDVFDIYFKHVGSTSLKYQRFTPPGCKEIVIRKRICDDCTTPLLPFVQFCSNFLCINRCGLNLYGKPVFKQKQSLINLREKTTICKLCSGNLVLTLINKEFVLMCTFGKP